MSIFTSISIPFQFNERLDRQMPRNYPVSLVLKDRKCVVIGAGIVAERKVRSLLECGARVLVVSPSITAGLKALSEHKKITYKKSPAGLKDLKGSCLVIAATADRAVNSRVYAYCRKNNIPVNVVDCPKECTFIVPSVIRRGDLTISISTGGISPALAKKIRRDLEKAFGAEYAGLLRMMKKIRPMVLKKMKSAQSRKKFFSKMLKDISGNAAV